MKFNTKTRYAIRVMLEIALDSAGKDAVLQKDIAINQNISNKYLDQIISSLKNAGLISVVRGKISGYILTRPPEQITMLDIHKAFEEEICLINCLKKDETCDRKGGCAAHNFWNKVNSSVNEIFESYTLEDMLKDHSAQNG